MLPRLVYNASHIAGMFMLLVNMNKHQHFEACLHCLACNCLLTQVRPLYESNQAEHLQTRSIQFLIPI